MQTMKMRHSVYVYVYVFVAFVFNRLGNSGLDAQVLPDAEVQTMETIFTKLNFVTGQQVTKTSCNDSYWNIKNDDGSRGHIKCNCTYSNNTVCHVTNVILRGFSLAGAIPEEFGNLTYLQEIDLSHNLINGSIPRSFTRLRNLTKLVIVGSRLGGSFPSVIADIATLEEVVLEDNLLVGALPESIVNMKRLRRLLLCSNNFMGPIPESYGNLTSLTDFRIDGSNLTGKIPDFIGNWINLQRLDLQGTGLEGPLPSTLSRLTNLIQLRISDLRGSSSRFPNLQDMKQMERLILRNCLITGTFPDSIGDMTELQVLDLSFNQLTGPVPGFRENLANIDYIFLTNNLLSGAIPDWILTSENHLDVSYNNFTESSPASCRQSGVNILSSVSSTGSNLVSWCLKKDLPCPSEAKYFSLFINCGGGAVDHDDNTYDEDLNSEGRSNFAIVGDKWAYSSSGIFVGNASSKYLATNQYELNVSGAEYYKTARIAPQSLKYYGFCLLQGSYTVKLHFAEIMYTNDQTYRSFGNRRFDVSIQGKQVLKDFDVIEEAGGVGIGITKEYKDVFINGSTLEIHLYWAGKGTTAIPYRGVYGPLISAISVTPNFKVDLRGGLSAGFIVGIVAGTCAAVILLLLLVLWKIGYLGGKDIEDKELRALDLQTGHFTLRQIKAATNNFDVASKIGEGGFGPVYKGTLSDGLVIAVKQLSSKSKQGNREFVNEIGMISALQHPNLVKLYGCCIEGNQLLLVYEYLENNSLARALFGKDEQRLNLDWAIRKRICLDIARGLAYLHEESRLKIVHRDIKAPNVLLDKLDEEENTHISTRIAGTIGYMAPEYAMRGYLTDKADVYSFGVVALEMVSGKSITNYKPNEEFDYLLDWACVLQEQGNLLELVDPCLGSNYSKKEAMIMLNVALLCTNSSPTLRPSMSSVVCMLQGKAAVQAPIIKRNSDSQDASFRALEVLSQDSQTHISAFSQVTKMWRTL